MPSPPISPAKIERLKKFLAQNAEVNWIQVSLQSPEAAAKLNWKGLTRYRKDLFAQALIYQRLSKLIPQAESTVLVALMEAGLHSALQAAALSPQQFVQTYGAILGTELQPLEVHQRALAIRSRLLVQYLDAKQNREPHLRQSVLNPQSK